ncbi:MAG: family 16 glycosylhydrolase [Bacteroidia bacterium]
MKKLFLILLAANCLNSVGQTPANDPHWNLLWSDDFNTFDASRWIKANYATHGTEPQVYLPSNVTTLGGNLILTARNNPVFCPSGQTQTTWACSMCNVGQTYPFNSAWIETELSSYPQYGYIEARIKLPGNNGLWPAFWTWTGSPSYQEIDIFEMIPGASETCNMDGYPYTHTINTMTSNIHGPGSTGLCNDPNSAPSVMYIQDYTQWHTYGIEWSPSRIIWYVDDYAVKYYMNSQITAPTRIILNLAIKPDVPLSGSLPQDMLVDYVRVYDMNKDCNDLINSSNYNFLSYNNIEKNFIKIGEGGGVNSVPVGQDVFLRASQYIDFAGDFSVPSGAGIYADANKQCSTDLGINCTLDFNPCTYNFSGYDNSVKRDIDLGYGCNVTVTPPAGNDILLYVTDAVNLGPGVSIVPTSIHSVNIKVTTCP